MRWPGRVIIACLMAGLITQRIPAQSTTRSTTLTTLLIVDLTSPKAAARTLWNAVTAEDAAVVAQALDAASNDDRELNEAIAALLVAGRGLSDEAREKFGKAADPVGRPMLDTTDLQKLQAANVTETGDSATIQIEGNPKPLSLRRREGKWRVVISDFAGATPENRRQQIKLVRDLASAVQELKMEIASGKYQTPQEAERYIQERLHEVMTEKYRPASAPSTRAVPTTR